MPGLRLDLIKIYLLCFLCSNYLFHELPNDIRKQAVAEMARVLRPGGLCILTDSVQLGDRDSMNASLGNFEDFNGKSKPGLPKAESCAHSQGAGLHRSPCHLCLAAEPYYRNYVATPLGPLFKEAGFLCGTKVCAAVLLLHHPAPSCMMLQSA